MTHSPCVAGFVSSLRMSCGVVLWRCVTGVQCGRAEGEEDPTVQGDASGPWSVLWAP